MTEKSENYTEKIVEYWSPDVITFFKRIGKKYTPIPPHNPECHNYFVRNKPEITSPTEYGDYEIDENIPLEYQKIPLKANVALDSDKVYWFCGSQLIAEGKPDGIYFFSPKRGEWVISVIDSKGRSDSIKIRIY